MKTLVTLVFIFPFLLFSQQPEMSWKSALDLMVIKRNIPGILKGDKALINELPILETGGHYYVSFIGRLRDNAPAVSIPEGIMIGNGEGKIRSVRVRLDALDQLSALTQVQYLELAGKIRPNLDKVAFDTRADSVHAGLGLPRSFTGKDVLIGVNDWGYDYAHPMFYDTLLQNTRVVAAWDQFKQSGPAPAGFGYGAEYNGAAELLAAQGDTSNQLSYSTHGTHVAGIAGGSGAGVIGKGMAFESQFLFTTILVDEAAALDSWEWMYQKAQQHQKRLVINMSWGLYHFGTNDGTSLLSQAITEYTDLGVLFVSSAGNNGNVNFHFQRQFNNDSILSRINFYDYSYHDSLWGQSIHGWGETGKNFEIKLQVRSSTNTLLAETAYFPTVMNGYDEGFLVVNTNDTVWYNVAAQEAHPQNSRPTVRLRVKNKHTTLRTDLVVRANEGNIHFWNLVELTTNGGNWGMPFTTAGAGYIAGDKVYGVGEPACAEDALTVAAHISEYLHPNGVSLIGGARADFSSIGPLYNGDMKPDISAPGHNVLSAISSFTDNSYSSDASLHFNGKEYHFARMSGTSMSSPVVTGICALIWEVNPYLTPRQVKTIVMETARQDNYTGVIPPEGSTSWGFGKINAKAAVELALETLGLEDHLVDGEKEWEVYPNPADATVSVKGFEQIDSVRLFDVSGKETRLDASQRTWSVSGYASGVYLFRVVSENRVYQKKIIIR